MAVEANSIVRWLHTKRWTGIYSAHFDDETGTLTIPQPYFTALGSPTYLAISQRQVMYAIDGDGDQGGLRQSI